MLSAQNGGLGWSGSILFMYTGDIISRNHGPNRLVRIGPHQAPKTTLTAAARLTTWHVDTYVADHHESATNRAQWRTHSAIRPLRQRTSSTCQAPQCSTEPAANDVVLALAATQTIMSKAPRPRQAEI